MCFSPTIFGQEESDDECKRKVTTCVWEETFILSYTIMILSTKIATKVVVLEESEKDKKSKAFSRCGNEMKKVLRTHSVFINYFSLHIRRWIYVGSSDCYNSSNSLHNLLYSRHYWGHIPLWYRMIFAAITSPKFPQTGIWYLNILILERIYLLKAVYDIEWPMTSTKELIDKLSKMFTFSHNLLALFVHSVLCSIFGHTFPWSMTVRVW